MNQLKEFEQLPQTSAQKLCAGTMVATVPLVSAQEGEKAKGSSLVVSTQSKNM